MPPTVLITESLEPEPTDWLAQRVALVHCDYKQPDELDRLLRHAAGLVVRTYTQVNDQFLDKAPNLKVIGRAGTGVDNIDLEACRRRNITVVHTPEATTQAVAEYVIALMLDVLRPRHSLPDHASLQEFLHARRQPGTQLNTVTLGILGFGRIGKRLGAIANAIGMKLLANDLLPEPELRKTVDYPYDFVDKSTLYRQSDILTIHVDGRSENHNLINAEVLSQLQPTCLLINAARGLVVEPKALADWARRSPDARIILDVHNPEPPPPEYPLYDLPNVRLLPHIASRTTKSVQDMCWVVRDVANVLEGRKPQFPVT